jgi:hypothetical protein
MFLGRYFDADRARRRSASAPLSGSIVTHASAKTLNWHGTMKVYILMSDLKLACQLIFIGVGALDRKGERPIAGHTPWFVPNVETGMSEQVIK